MRTVKLFSFLLGCTFVSVLFIVFELNFSSLICDLPEQNVSFITIEDNIEDAKIEGIDNIFFIEAHTTNFHKLDSHQACSIESAGNVIKLCCASR